MPSLAAQWTSYDLLNPVVKLVAKSSSTPSLIMSNRSFLKKKKTFPCDLRLINMRSMQKYETSTAAKTDHAFSINQVGLIFHRVAYEDCPSAPLVQLNSALLNECNNENYNEFSFGDLFSFVNTFESMRVESTLLTLHTPKILADDEQALTHKDFILSHVQPMQIEAFRVKFQWKWLKSVCRQKRIIVYSIKTFLFIEILKILEINNWFFLWTKVIILILYYFFAKF